MGAHDLQAEAAHPPPGLAYAVVEEVPPLLGNRRRAERIMVAGGKVEHGKTEERQAYQGQNEGFLHPYIQ